MPHLENVTLAADVKFVVKVAVDFLGRTVLAEEPAEDSLTTHPEDFDWHTGLGRTLTLAWEEM